MEQSIASQICLFVWENLTLRKQNKFEKKTFKTTWVTKLEHIKNSVYQLKLVKQWLEFEYTQILEII